MTDKRAPFHAGTLPPAPESTVELCESCTGPVVVMAFRGTGVCSVACRKQLGRDVPSVGTMMFVTPEEKAKIERKRNRGTA